jgi:hypothetical protein
VARNLSLPSGRLWLFGVTRSNTGVPVVDRVGRLLDLPSAYDVPPDATQARSSRLLETGDARLTQAVLARSPRRGDTFSLWTQHTVAFGAVSAVRWYEINPEGAPTLRAHGQIGAADRFFYNAAISPNRRVDGATRDFGSSFVIGYNVSGAAAGIAPRIGVATSVGGGPLTLARVREAARPYADYSCSAPGSTCRWGEQASAAPDPRPAGASRGAVWLTNQFAGSTSTSTARANWRTWIWAVQP